MSFIALAPTKAYKNNPEKWNRVVFINSKIQLSCMGSGTGFFASLPITVSKGNNVRKLGAKSVNADQIGH